MKNLIVDEKSFGTEREVVQNERRYRKENSPEGQIHQEIYSLVFSQHPYRWPVIGYEEDLNRMTAEDARMFYQRHYAPNRAVVVVSGDVDAARVRKLAQRYYGAYSPTDATAVSVAMVQEPEQKTARRKTLRLNIQVEKLLIAYPIPSASHEDMPALDVLQTVLSGGRSSRLQKALVETGIATDAYTYAADAKDPSIFFVGATLQSSQKALTAERIALRELERLAKEPILGAELERAKNIINFEYFGNLETNSERARFAGYYESQLGALEKGPAMHARIQAVTPEQVQSVAQKYFTENRRNTIISLRKPEEKK
jgi:predicted Zn-dependent peptidase